MLHCCNFQFGDTLMLAINGYRFDKKIVDNDSVKLYKGVRISDGCPILAKSNAGETYEHTRAQSFEHELNITKILQDQGILEHYSVEYHDNSKYLIVEDFDGISLEEYLKKSDWDLKKYLKIIVDISKVIRHIHKSLIIHANLSVNNILINPDTGQIKISDFKFAFIHRAGHYIFSDNFTYYNMEYLSPEQTGRLNRPVDFRSDLYLLGLVFYEILMSRKPFDFQDQSEQLHAHIARKPENPSKIKPEIPEVLSDMILKLLEKNPEDRYQSITGLLFDLSKCYNQYITSGKIFQFQLATKDVPEQFSIPDKIYGMEQELKLLNSNYKKIMNGDRRLIIIAGPEGSGKTFLINEMHRKLSEKHDMLFISSGFEKKELSRPLGPLYKRCKDYCEANSYIK